MPNTKPEYFFLSSRNPFQSFDHIHAHKHFIPSSSSYYPCLTLNPKFMVSFALFLHAILCFICFPDVFLPAFLTQSLILDRHGLHLHLKKITSPSDSSSNKPLTSFWLRWKFTYIVFTFSLHILAFVLHLNIKLKLKIIKQLNCLHPPIYSKLHL